MNELILKCLDFFCVFVIGFCIGWLTKKPKEVEKIKEIHSGNFNNEWIPIKDFPEIDFKKISGVKYLLTNGEDVREMWGRPYYNNQGKIILNVWENKEATHWMPFPKPPKK